MNIPDPIAWRVTVNGIKLIVFSEMVGHPLP